jgi:hypothetical protein
VSCNRGESGCTDWQSAISLLGVMDMLKVSPFPAGLSRCLACRARHVSRLIQAIGCVGSSQQVFSGAWIRSVARSITARGDLHAGYAIRAVQQPSPWSAAAIVDLNEHSMRSALQHWRVHGVLGRIVAAVMHVLFRCSPGLTSTLRADPSADQRGFCGMRS